MTRSHRLPLFRATEPDVYEFDTSSWFNIDPRPDSEQVWQLVIRLINQGRIVSCLQVLDEMRNDPIFTRLHSYEVALRTGDHKGDDPSYLQHVGRITHDYPAMSKATGRKTPADPYVVALAELEGYVVVCDESIRRQNRKIPGVCQQRNIRCITLDEFVAANSAGAAGAAS